MLRELKDVLKEGEPHRRIFEDSVFDLFVWYDSSLCREIIGFQLTYGTRSCEKAFTWFKDRGFTHEKVDDPSSAGGSKMTPILIADASSPMDGIITLFKKSAAETDGVIRNFVISKMHEFENIQESK